MKSTWILKKFFAIFLLIFFSLNIFGASIVSAKTSNWEIMKNIIIYKQELKKTKKWADYIKALDSFIENSSNEKLEKVSERIDLLLEKNTKLNPNILNLVKYLKYSIDYKLLKKENSKTEEKVEKNKEVKVEEKKEEKLENIDESEKQKVRTEVLKLQKNLLDKWEKVFLDIKKGLEENYNVEERWDLDIKFKLDQKNIWNIDYKLFLEDYLAKSNSDFDSSLKWDLKSFLYYNLKWEGLWELDLSTRVEQISKWWDIYIKLQNFHISNEKWMEDIKEFLDIVKKMWEKESFIKVQSDENTKKVLEFVKNINPKNLKSKSREFENKALFEAYGKDWNKYKLKPTKFACEKYKEFVSVFSPFYGKNCSESQYEDMVKELKDLWNIYMEFNSGETTLGFESNSDEVNIKTFVKYTPSNIKSISFEAIPLEERFKWEYIKFNYLDKSHLNFNYIINWATLNFNSKLDFNNKFKDIDFNLKSKENKSTANLKLKNNKITWKFNLVESWYDYNDKEWKVIDRHNIKWTIIWNTSGDNSLDNLTIDYTWKDLIKNEENLKWKFSLKKDYIEFNVKMSGEWIKFDFQLNSKFDEKYFPIDWKLRLDVFKKDGKLDLNTYKYNYSWDFKKVFTTDINIKSREIKWITKAIDNFTINHSWWISNERLDLENSFVVEKKMIEEINNSNEVLNPDFEKVRSVNWNFNIKSEFSSNNSNLSVNSFINLNNKEVMNFSLKNNSNISKEKEVFIETPKDYIELEDLIK